MSRQNAGPPFRRPPNFQPRSPFLIQPRGNAPLLGIAPAPQIANMRPLGPPRPGSPGNWTRQVASPLFHQQQPPRPIAAHGGPRPNFPQAAMGSVPRPPHQHLPSLPLGSQGAALGAVAKAAAAGREQYPLKRARHDMSPGPQSVSSPAISTPLGAGPSQPCLSCSSSHNNHIPPPGQSLAPDSPQIRMMRVDVINTVNRAPEGDLGALCAAAVAGSLSDLIPNHAENIVKSTMPTLGRMLNLHPGQLSKLQQRVGQELQSVLQKFVDDTFCFELSQYLEALASQSGGCECEET